MTILAIGLIVCYIYMGGKLGDKDINNDLSKNLTIIAIITGICTFIWGVLTYFFFMSNTNHVIPYLLISQSFVMFISLFSLAVSTIQSVSL